MTITKHDLERYADRECQASTARQIEEAVQTDPGLAAQLELIVRMNDVLQGQGQQICAPDSLRQTVHAKYARPTQTSRRETSSSRRSWMFGGAGALAATIAGVSVLPLVWRKEPEDVAHTFFRDFETFLLKDRTVDIIESDPLRVAQWYQSRLPFTLPPVSGSGAGAKLVGARLCWLLERRLASLSYETPNGPVVLYITKADGLNLPARQKDAQDNMSWHRTSDYTGLIWQSNDLLMAMIGTQALHKLKRIARTVTG